MGGEQDLSESASEERRHADYGSIEMSDDDTVISKGALDPVYEAKAKVLNRAVSQSHPAFIMDTRRAHTRYPDRVWKSLRKDVKLTLRNERFKILAWAGTNGSFSLLSVLAGPATTSGLS